MKSYQQDSSSIHVVLVSSDILLVKNTYGLLLYEIPMSRASAQVHTSITHAIAVTPCWSHTYSYADTNEPMISPIFSDLKPGDHLNRPIAVMTSHALLLLNIASNPTNSTISSHPTTRSLGSPSYRPWRSTMGSRRAVWMHTVNEARQPVMMHINSCVYHTWHDGDMHAGLLRLALQGGAGERITLGPTATIPLRADEHLLSFVWDEESRRGCILLTDKITGRRGTVLTVDNPPHYLFKS